MHASGETVRTRARATFVDVLEPSGTETNVVQITENTAVKTVRITTERDEREKKKLIRSYRNTVVL